MAAEKIAKLQLKRDDDVIMFVKHGDVWAMARAKPGARRGKSYLIAKVGVELDYSRYLYFVDADGDVARMPRKILAAEPKRAPRKKRKTTANASTPRRPSAL